MNSEDRRRRASCAAQNEARHPSPGNGGSRRSHNRNVDAPLVEAIREQPRPVRSVLDATGNLGGGSVASRACLDQQLSPDTYTDWDVRQLEASLLETFAAEDEPPKDLTTPFACARVPE